MLRFLRKRGRRSSVFQELSYKRRHIFKDFSKGFQRIFVRR